LAEQGVPAYLVGGCVRDRLLGRPVYDLDVAVAGDGLALARRLANRFGGAYYPLDEARSTGRAILPDEERQLVVDIARFRGPDVSEQGLAGDLADRDFTVNALAADVRAPEQVIDLHGGQADLALRVIRPVSEASIRRDPVRALRGFRLAAELGFALSPEAQVQIRRDGPQLDRASGERVRDELARLLTWPDAAPSLRQMDSLGLLTVVLPELEPLRGLAQPPPHHLDGLAHSLATVEALESLLTVAPTGRGLPRETDRLSSDGLPAELIPFAPQIVAHLNRPIGGERTRLVTLKLAALLHDSGKAATFRQELAPGARVGGAGPGGRIAGAQDGQIPEMGHGSPVGETRIRFINHDQVGVAIVGTAFRRLRLTGAETHLAETIVRHHMRPLLLAGQEASARAVYRFFRDTGEAGVDVLVHALADHRATYAPDGEGWYGTALVALIARMLADYWQRPAQRVAPPLLVNGHDLLEEFDLQPGPLIGELLELVREAQVSGEVSTRKQALALIQQRLARP
jgi:tRNA nucleotidyltransferase/poly(A) polymerase